MTIIDRYIYDVTRRLSERQRSDVARELEADILEMVDDEANGKKPTKDHAVAVLQRLGHPAKLADSYRDSPRYIIGPEQYETYKELLKILLAVVVPIVAFLALMSQLMITRDSLIDTVVHVGGAALELTVHIVFWTTLSFFIIGKFNNGKFNESAEKWTPSQLPELPPKQSISRTESYFAIAWSVFAIVATLVQFPGIHQMIQASVPLFFSAEFREWWIVGLLAVSVAGLSAEVAKLVVGGWTRLTVALVTILNLITIAFFVSAYYIVQPIVNPDFTQAIEKITGISGVAESFHTGVAVFVAIVGAICIWEIIEAWTKYKKGVK